MNIIKNEDPTEAQARTETTCRGCRHSKEIGLVVCWDCFKYRTDITPLKEFAGTLTQWLNEFRLND